MILIQLEDRNISNRIFSQTKISDVTSPSEFLRAKDKIWTSTLTCVLHRKETGFLAQQSTNNYIIQSCFTLCWICLQVCVIAENTAPKPRKTVFWQGLSAFARCICPFCHSAPNAFISMLAVPRLKWLWTCLWNVAVMGTSLCLQSCIFCKRPLCLIPRIYPCASQCGNFHTSFCGSSQTPPLAYVGAFSCKEESHFFVLVLWGLFKWKIH